MDDQQEVLFLQRRWVKQLRALYYVLTSSLYLPRRQRLSSNYSMLPYLLALHRLRPQLPRRGLQRVLNEQKLSVTLEKRAIITLHTNLDCILSRCNGKLFTLPTLGLRLPLFSALHRCDIRWSYWDRDVNWCHLGSGRSFDMFLPLVFLGS